MKKIITLLLCVGTVATAFSQTNDEEARRIILGKRTGSPSTPGGGTSNDPRDIILGGGDRRVNDGNDTRYPNGTYGSRQQQIDQVNREYDSKIQSIRNNPTLSAAEKERMIRQLEADRARRIRDINRYYDTDRRDRDRDRNDRDRDDDDDDDRYKQKGNNGNHYGWEKGKGNPHKYGQPGRDNNSGKGYEGKSKNKSNGKGKSKGRD